MRLRRGVYARFCPGLHLNDYDMYSTLLAGTVVPCPFTCVRVCAFSLAVVCRRVCTPHAPSPMPGVPECHPWCGEGCPTFGRVPDPYGLRGLSQYVTPPVLY